MAVLLMCRLSVKESRFAFMQSLPKSRNIRVVAFHLSKATKEKLKLAASRGVDNVGYIIKPRFSLVQIKL